MSERFVPMVEPPEGHAGPAVWLAVRDGEVLVVPAAEGVDLPLAADPAELGVPVGDAHFLGLLGGQPVWAVDAGPDGEAALDAAAAGLGTFEQLRALHGRVDDARWALAGRAVQIVEWARTHRFCGRCATPTEPQRGERARRCPGCGLLAFPRLAPAVIVTIERDDEILLARGRSFPIPMYSALAGFVEPGETLEEAVVREVAEESGVQVGPPRYVSSQPWPFPSSLMLGFIAPWVAGEPAPEEDEIEDVRWFSRDEVAAAAADDIDGWGGAPDPADPDATSLLLPPRLAIARRLIEHWLDG